MEFSDFDLTLLLILVTEKLSKLEFDLKSLEYDKRFIFTSELEIKERDLKSSIVATNELKNKITIMLEE